MEWSNLLPLIVGATGGGTLAAIVYVVAGHKESKARVDKLEAEATDIIASAAGNLVDRINKHADENEAELIGQIEDLKKVVATLSTQVKDLIQQLEDNGIQPKFTPKL